MTLTSHAILRIRLASHLLAVGGAAKRSEILDALQENYGELWTDDDQTPQTTRQFETKWRNRVSFERQRMVEAGLLVHRTDGIWELSDAGLTLAGELRAHGATEVDLEFARREKLWERLRTSADTSSVATSVIRDLGLYSGARGIYVDVPRTRNAAAPDGIALTFLDLGYHYANEVLQGGVIYRFPSTARPGRDAAEVRAVLKAYELTAPIFFVSRDSGRGRGRAVQRGFVEKIDTFQSAALLTFLGDVDLPPGPEPEHTPFSLVASPEQDGWSRRRSRPNQARFAFEVIQRYGRRCAVCDIAVTSVIEAAHLRPKSVNGADDARNGLALCSNHHRMFDAHVWAIDPVSLNVVVPAGDDFRDFGLTRPSIGHLPALPHADALQHAWGRWGARARSSSELT